MKILNANRGGLSFYMYKAFPSQVLIRVDSSHIKSYDEFKEQIVKLAEILEEPGLLEKATYANIMNSSISNLTLKEVQNLLVKDILMWEVYLYNGAPAQVHEYSSPRLEHFDPDLKERLTNYFIRAVEV